MVCVKFDQVLLELEKLVRETFYLWDEIRVGFSWRHYYYNHTLRVRSLCLRMGSLENADLRQLAVAATLHDITKRYDGAIATDAEGNRIVDEQGFWKNQVLLPARNNLVTELYRLHNLFGQMHHNSGAIIADEILKGYRFSSRFRTEVSKIIQAHLRPRHPDPAFEPQIYTKPESQILHDADMIDANLGLVAFYRNIQIHTGQASQRNVQIDLPAYIHNVRNWVESKRSFLPRLLSNPGREVAIARWKRNLQLCEWLEKELEDLDCNLRYGIVGLVQCFMDHHQDPSLSRDLEWAQKVWIPDRRRELDDHNLHNYSTQQPAGKHVASLHRVAEFLRLLEAEVAGEL